MPDLTPAEARERLLCWWWGDDDRSFDGFLATTDALAVLVTWPALLAAGERAGRLEMIDRQSTGCSKCGADHVSVTFNYDVPWGPDDDRRTDWTDPEAAP